MRARASRSSSSHRACATRKRRALSVRTRRESTRSARRERDRIALPGERRAQEPVVRLGEDATERRAGSGQGPSTGRAATSPTVKRSSAQAGTSCRQRTSGSSAVASSTISSRNARRCGGTAVAVEEVPAPDEHATTLLRCASCSPTPRRSRPGTTTSSPPRSRRAGADVELATSRFRFGELPAADGYRRTERFYPLSSRLFKRSRLRLPLKAAEHAGVLAALARAKPDVVHVQWLALPQADVHLRFRAPSVFTAHDLLPRRTLREARPLGAAARAVRPGRRSHRPRPRDARRAGDRRARDPAPRLPERGDRGGRRPHAALARRHPPVQGARRLDRGDAPAAVTLGCSSRATRRCRSTSCAAPTASSGGSATSPRPSSTARLSESTLALFPYRAELDQSGALLQALGAGVPAVVYDVAGLAEPIRRYGAGASFPPATSTR